MILCSNSKLESSQSLPIRKSSNPPRLALAILQWICSISITDCSYNLNDNRPLTSWLIVLSIFLFHQTSPTHHQYRYQLRLPMDHDRAVFDR
ncbi:hypothetical protein O181_080391 [Austropuccinia psidii MF-1]|uniref:Uncharacterized protein n=1 Tax=Austropuccinia psidii MF-1 TaxID=1389203 RepID=A0A9Q3FI49_9BASI|nr:hypothetical protein [Austropuccinia psidii MF-1]